MNVKVWIILLLGVMVSFMITMAEINPNMRRHHRAGYRRSYSSSTFQVKSRKFQQQPNNGYRSRDDWRKDEEETRKRAEELWEACGPKAFMKDGEVLPREVSIYISS